jgi:hypothetical protein
MTIETRDEAMALNTLKNEEIVQIAKGVVAANNIPAQAVSTAPALDIEGLPAVEVIISLAPGTSFDFLKDGRSSHVVSEIIRLVEDRGEERFPFVHFEMARAS